MCVVYLRPGGRRPIWLGVRPAMRDIQADIPAGWCEVCGKEVFSVGQQLCQVCALRKESEYGNRI